MTTRYSPIPLASHLATGRAGYSHHGIYMGRDRVIQYSGLADGPENGPVNVVSLDRFCSGVGYTIVPHPEAKYSKDEIIQRAKRRLGENRYDVAGNNCEHFVYWAIEGRHRSPQVSGATAAAAGVSASCAALAARGIVASAGAVAGLSGAGTMSGLAAIGGPIGAGVVGGIGGVSGSGGLATASLMNNTVLRDDESLPGEERSSRAIGRGASYLGAAAGTAGSIGAIAAAGVPGLSAVGITTGLATIGGSVGGGMAAGLAVTAAAPVAAAVVLGYGIYKLMQWWDE